MKKFFNSGLRLIEVSSQIMVFLVLLGETYNIIAKKVMKHKKKEVIEPVDKKPEQDD